MPDSASDVPVQQGLSLRDYLALNAPAAPDNYWDHIEANPESNPDLKQTLEDGEILSPGELAARFAYEYADAMLEERKRVKP